MDGSEKAPAQAAEETRNGKPLTDQDLEKASGGAKPMKSYGGRGA